MSRKHPVQTINLLDSRFIVDVQEDELDELRAEEGVIGESGREEDIIEYENDEASDEDTLLELNDEAPDISEDDEEIFIKAVAIMVIQDKTSY